MIPAPQAANEVPARPRIRLAPSEVVKMSLGNVDRSRRRVPITQKPKAIRCPLHTPILASAYIPPASPNKPGKTPPHTAVATLVFASESSRTSWRYKSSTAARPHALNACNEMCRSRPHPGFRAYGRRLIIYKRCKRRLRSAPGNRMIRRVPTSRASNGERLGRETIMADQNK